MRVHQGSTVVVVGGNVVVGGGGFVYGGAPVIALGMRSGGGGGAGVSHGGFGGTPKPAGTWGIPALLLSATILGAGLKLPIPKRGGILGAGGGNQGGGGGTKGSGFS